MLDVRNVQDVGTIEHIRVGRELTRAPHLVSLAVWIDGRIGVAELPPRDAFDLSTSLLEMAAFAAAHAARTETGSGDD